MSATRADRKALSSSPRPTNSETQRQRKYGTFRDRALPRTVISPEARITPNEYSLRAVKHVTQNCLAGSNCCELLPQAHPLKHHGTEQQFGLNALRITLGSTHGSRPTPPNAEHNNLLRARSAQQSADASTANALSHCLTESDPKRPLSTHSRTSPSPTCTKTNGFPEHLQPASPNASSHNK